MTTAIVDDTTSFDELPNWTRPESLQNDGSDAFRQVDGDTKRYLIIDQRPGKFHDGDDITGVQIRLQTKGGDSETHDFWKDDYEHEGKFRQAVIGKALELMGIDDDDDSDDDSEFDPEVPESGNYHKAEDLQAALEHFDSQTGAAQHWNVNDSTISRWNKKHNGD